MAKLYRRVRVGEGTVTLLPSTADAVDIIDVAKQDTIDNEHKLDYSLIDNTPVAISDAEIEYITSN